MSTDLTQVPAHVLRRHESILSGRVVREDDPHINQWLNGLLSRTQDELARRRLQQIRGATMQKKFDELQPYDCLGDYHDKPMHPNGLAILISRHLDVPVTVCNEIHFDGRFSDMLRGILLQKQDRDHVYPTNKCIYVIDSLRGDNTRVVSWTWDNAWIGFAEIRKWDPSDGPSPKQAR